MNELYKERCVLITGVAGFIGYHFAEKLLHEGIKVVGIDNCNDYYLPVLKEQRLARLLSRCGTRFHFVKADLNEAGMIANMINEHGVTEVVHLAAQAGVRYSIENPFAYSHSNLSGFLHLLEAVRLHPVRQVIYASSSSVYGDRASNQDGFNETEATDEPVSLYAATKKANEVIAHAYAHLYNIRLTGVRFFTVYGPWGRPDMAYFRFADALAKRKPIVRYGLGQLKRDLTYIDDAVEALTRLLNHHSIPSAFDQITPHQIYNIGHQHPICVQQMIDELANAYGVQPIIHDESIQPGDVQMTCSNPQKLYDAIGYWKPTAFSDGIQRFVQWHRTWKIF